MMPGVIIHQQQCDFAPNVSKSGCNNLDSQLSLYMLMYASKVIIPRFLHSLE